VFKEGRYTIKVGEGEATHVFEEVESLEPGESRTLEVAFDRGS
jgi:uncharacterized cupredoxin-like copper-binding protein